MFDRMTRSHETRKHQNLRSSKTLKHVFFLTLLHAHTHTHTRPKMQQLNSTAVEREKQNEFYITHNSHPAATRDTLMHNNTLPVRRVLLPGETAG